jgi:hypothetical protein
MLLHARPAGFGMVRKAEFRARLTVTFVVNCWITPTAAFV